MGKFHFKNICQQETTWRQVIYYCITEKWREVSLLIATDNKELAPEYTASF